jgi:hypothetical protein
MTNAVYGYACSQFTIYVSVENIGGFSTETSVFTENEVLAGAESTSRVSSSFIEVRRFVTFFSTAVRRYYARLCWVQEQGI